MSASCPVFGGNRDRAVLVTDLIGIHTFCRRFVPCCPWRQLCGRQETWSHNKTIGACIWWKLLQLTLLDYFCKLLWGLKLRYMIGWSKLKQISNTHFIAFKIEKTVLKVPLLWPSIYLLCVCEHLHNWYMQPVPKEVKHILTGLDSNKTCFFSWKEKKMCLLVLAKWFHLNSCSVSR